MEMDKYLVNTQVDYEPPFDVNDSFDTILTDFMEQSPCGSHAGA